MSDPVSQIKNIKIKLRVATRKAINKAAKEIAVYILDIIKIRTRYEGEGLKGQLKELKSVPYIKLREKSKNLSDETSPNKSNLTATGQLLDALQGKAVGDKVTIDIKNSKRKFELDGPSSSLTNKEVRRYVEESGREFLGLTQAEKDDAINVATQIIEQEIKDALRNT